jgi:hypothetical protein
MKRLTQSQEDVAHVFTLCGALGVDYPAACNVVRLQALGRVLRKRFEAICSYEWANTEAYGRRTDTAVKAALQLVFTLGLTCDVNRDPRGPALKLKTREGREFFL